MPDLVQVHPSDLVTAPDGTQVAIDVGILPLIRRLWSRGWSTLGSCQDMGDAHAGGGAPGGQRAGAFFAGYAWLKMPNEDASAFFSELATDPAFAERLDRWTHPDGWYAYCLHGAAGLYKSTQIYFPVRQLEEVLNVLDSPPAAQ
jgi:hypothetical protein